MTGVFRRSSSMIHSVGIDIAAALGVSFESSSASDRGSLSIGDVGNIKGPAQAATTNSKKAIQPILGSLDERKSQPDPVNHLYVCPCKVYCYGYVKFYLILQV